MRVEDALGKKASGDSSPGASPAMADSPARSYRDELTNDLAESLSISPSKADRLATVICALAREEMSGGLEEESEEAAEDKGPKSLAVILGSGKSRE